MCVLSTYKNGDNCYVDQETHVWVELINFDHLHQKAITFHLMPGKKDFMKLQYLILNSLNIA